MRLCFCPKLFLSLRFGGDDLYNVCFGNVPRCCPLANVQESPLCLGASTRLDLGHNWVGNGRRWYSCLVVAYYLGAWIRLESAKNTCSFTIGGGLLYCSTLVVVDSSRDINKTFKWFRLEEFQISFWLLSMEIEHRESF